RKRAIKVLNVSSNNDLKHFYTSYISIEAEFFATHHNYHYSIINSFIDKYDYKKFHKAEYANSNYFNSLKISDPYTENEELYKDLYYYFFVDLTKSPIDQLRQEMVRFMTVNLNKN